MGAARLARCLRFGAFQLNLRAGELRQKLWPNGTIVEFDHSINAAVKRLRQALEDTDGEPEFIETSPRRGYRFLVSVERGTPNSALRLRHHIAESFNKNTYCRTKPAVGFRGHCAATAA
jgi:DNA-binding winged helix-turn-helix (wHTH) protein